MDGDSQPAHHTPDDDSADLPELLEGVWPRGRILELFEDLHLGAEVSHVQLRERTAEGVQDHTTSLDQARDSFETGAAQAIQIRYTFEEETWCDTLMPQGNATKVIRTRMEHTDSHAPRD